MSVATLIIYEVKPEDPEAFFDYYLNTHIPIAKKMPHLKQIKIDKGVGGDIFMITSLIFDNHEEMEIGTNSPEREKAKADMANFPAYSGEVRRQVVEIMEV